ncbi:N-acetyltransferase family protein [Actinophytocola sp.]|uniref:GNAT family N-acetyltransferase n=1 Tax=Actinophytocola sp. TaxID=1872138 RepID=UPI003D6C4D43
MTGTETITVRRLTPDDWRTWREVRLASLADAPHAYGSSLAREEGFGEADWRQRLDPANGMTAVATLGDRVVGAVGGYTPPGADAVLLIAMWAAPAVRGRGVGGALVRDVLAWARENGWSRVELRVADGNTAARGLFERSGFVATGLREPLESDPTVGTETLVRKV